jgi:hypothetical protein
MKAQLIMKGVHLEPGVREFFPLPRLVALNLYQCCITANIVGDVNFRDVGTFLLHLERLSWILLTSVPVPGCRRAAISRTLEVER